MVGKELSYYMMVHIYYKTIQEKYHPEMTALINNAKARKAEWGVFKYTAKDIRKFYNLGIFYVYLDHLIFASDYWKCDL